MKQLLTLASMAVFITACGGGGGGGGDNEEVTLPITVTSPAPVDIYSPEKKSVSSLRLLDASGQSLPNAEVTVSRVLASSSFSAQAVADVLITDADGNLVINDLSPGDYDLTVTIAGVTVTMKLTVTENNSEEGMTAAVPVKVSTDGAGFVTAIDLTNSGLIISVSGMVYGEAGPIAGAQVSVSGGEGTNGAITSAVTDEHGSYVVVINIGNERKEALESGTIRVSAQGYKTLTVSANSDIDVTTSGASAGLNFMLAPEVDPPEVYYSENFEQTAEGAVCGTWTEEYVASTLELDSCFDCGVSEELVAASVVSAQAVTAPLLLWNSHSVGRSIYNQAYLDGLVSLAPNDASEGLVVDPQSNAACWYGNDVTGTQSTGNFIGEPDTEFNDDNPLNGGESLVANGAAIVSPQIDLTGLVAPVALSFDTWWEIESVNPNELGFDIMAVEYSTDNGESWSTLARLNPYTDPISGDEDWVPGETEAESIHPRAPIPYSNTGFNSAPLWLQQEPISLDALIGNVVLLRFAFRTQDELYNGFRGWVIDNVEISASKGTFPIFDDSEGDPLDDLPPEGVEFSMIVDITPEGTSLNAGSTTTFEAIVDWVGGDVETLSLELLRDGETVLLEQVSSADFNSDEGGYYYDLSGDYSSNIDGAFTVQLTAKDSSGVVVFTKDVEYQLYPI
jgi:hypothetical protein